MAFRGAENEVFGTFKKQDSGIKSELALLTKEDKMKNLSASAHVIYTTAKHVISSRRRKGENDCEKCTCKAGKNTDFHFYICYEL